MEEPQDLTKGKQKGNTGRASLAFSHNPLPYKEHTDEELMEVDALPGTNERQGGGYISCPLQFFL